MTYLKVALAGLTIFLLQGCSAENSNTPNQRCTFPPRGTAGALNDDKPIVYELDKSRTLHIWNFHRKGAFFEERQCVRTFPITNAEVLLTDKSKYADQTCPSLRIDKTANSYVVIKDGDRYSVFAVRSNFPVYSEFEFKSKLSLIEGKDGVARFHGTESSDFFAPHEANFFCKMVKNGLEFDNAYMRRIAILETRALPRRFKSPADVPPELIDAILDLYYCGETSSARRLYAKAFPADGTSELWWRKLNELIEESPVRAQILQKY